MGYFSLLIGDKWPLRGSANPSNFDPIQLYVTVRLEEFPPNISFGRNSYGAQPITGKSKKTAQCQGGYPNLPNFPQ